MDLEGSRQREARQADEDYGMDLPSQQNKNRHIRQKIYNPKRDSENSKRKDSRKKKNVNGLG